MPEHWSLIVGDENGPIGAMEYGPIGAERSEFHVRMNVDVGEIEIEAS